MFWQLQPETARHASLLLPMRRFATYAFCMLKRNRLEWYRDSACSAHKREPVSRKNSLLASELPLDISLAHLFGQMLRGSHGQRHNRHGGILPSPTHEATAIDYEKILNIMALVPLIQHAGLRIVPHPAGA